jgi:two-component system, NarL family, nitrate/nitrite response regulator NarL
MTMKRIRVLIVDDEPDVRMLLRLRLEAIPEFLIVGDVAVGDEALRRCYSAAPEAIVMDLLIPNVDGFEAIERFREALPDIGIVAYTAVAGTFVRDEMHRLGVELALKSGDIESLAEALRRCVARIEGDSSQHYSTM